MGRPMEAELHAILVGGCQRRLDQQAVAVLGPPRPAADRLVPALPRCTQQPVLLERVDDLLEAEKVGLQGRHVGEEKRKALVPAIREVPDIQGRDAERDHAISVP